MKKNVLIKNVSDITHQEPEIKVNKTLKPTSEANANVEAEKGETVVTDLSYTGLPEFYKITGKSHAKGGTPLRLTDSSFVFSKDKALKIKKEELQKDFQKPFKKDGYTPADLSLKYDINKYREVLADPNSDDLQIKTAQLMISNYIKKLGKLSLIQESMKGFPQGIPHIAIPFITDSNFDMTQVYATQGQEESSDDAGYAQKGKEIQPKRKVKVTNIPAYDAEEKVFLQTLSPDVKLPEDFVESKQGTNAGVFGRFDEKSANDNWAWYGKKINWNDPASVSDAQKAYNSRLYNKMITAGYSPKTANLAVSRIGFVNDPNKPNSLDAKAGKYTETRKDFDIPANNKQSFTEQAKVVNNLPAIKTNSISPTVTKDTAPFWLQDQINAAGAFTDMNKIKKYMPWQAPVDLTVADPTFYDPTRELAANAEAANIASTSVGMYAGAQNTSARASEIQGNALDNAANILGKYNNMNVGVANQFAQSNNQINNQEALLKADMANNLYKDTIVANQQFDNAKAMAREKFRGSLTNALTNRAQTQALNFTNEQYQVDPTSGGLVYFNKARPFDPENLKGQTQPQNLADTIKNLLTTIPGMTPDVAYKIATGK